MVLRMHRAHYGHLSSNNADFPHELQTGVEKKIYSDSSPRAGQSRQRSTVTSEGEYSESTTWTDGMW